MTVLACAALGVSRATVQRRRANLAAPAAVLRPRARPARALSAPQQQVVLDVLHAPDFVDQAPAEVYATLLDQDIYHCSIRTMYRILAQHAEVRERRAQLRHPAYQKPELLAEGPNQVSVGAELLHAQASGGPELAIGRDICEDQGQLEVLVSSRR